MGNKIIFCIAVFLFVFAVTPLVVRGIEIEQTGKHIPVCAAYGLCDAKAGR